MSFTRCCNCVAGRRLYGYSATIAVLALGLAFTNTALSMNEEIARARAIEPAATNSVFPTMSPEHRHARALLENAMRYVADESGTKDAGSGYPVEGWNNEPDKGLGLRSFTQLTAIGEWADLLANVVAGNADTPYLSREQALRDLQQLVSSLICDQKDPQTGAKGLLGNFLDLAPGRRMGPLVGSIERQRFLDTFGVHDGEAIWGALNAKGWLSPQGDGGEAAILRSSSYGAAFFNGPLEPYADEATKSRIMALMDRRAAILVFGDNVNLSSSLATAIGALLSPQIRDNPDVCRIRKDMEQFLENQREGYSFLFDADAGLFFFGWDGSRNRFLGWHDAGGKLRPAHMDYMVNEFRGPTAFVTMRYRLPSSAFGRLGLTIKPYRLASGRDVYVPAPWDGSAFQALGLGMSVTDRQCRSWNVLLKDVVEAEIDYSRRQKLPGFLSECYVGEGARYKGEVGIPDIAVNTSPRITHVGSLYTLGTAYSLAPEKMERFLADNWSQLSTLLTSHGPWEAFHAVRQEPVRVQTTAHTLSLVLGLLGTGPENMMRYLEWKELQPLLQQIYPAGQKVDLLSAENNCVAWDTGGTSLQSERGPAGFHVKGSRISRLGLASVSTRKEGMNLSNGVLVLRYRSTGPLPHAKVRLKPAAGGAQCHLPIELVMHLGQTACWRIRSR